MYALSTAKSCLWKKMIICAVIASKCFQYDCVACRDDQFRCHNTGRCIDGSYVCNAYDDCEDMSDEQNCSEWSSKLYNYSFALWATRHRNRSKTAQDNQKTTLFESITFLTLITVCTVVQNCCKGDSPCQWKTTIFTPSEIKNPWTDRHQTW